MYDKLLSEVDYRFSRSSGPGGQSVNKVSTQVELLFNVLESNILTEDQKNIIMTQLSNRITVLGVLVLRSDETRSQLKNRELVNFRFLHLIEDALVPVKKRKPTKPTRSSVQRRLTDKKKQSEKKKHRRVDED